MPSPRPLVLYRPSSFSLPGAFPRPAFTLSTITLRESQQLRDGQERAGITPEAPPQSQEPRSHADGEINTCILPGR